MKKSIILFRLFRHFLQLFLFFNLYASAETIPDSLKIKLQWEEVPSVSAYLVQISQDSSFKTVLVEEKTQTPEWKWNLKVDDLFLNSTQDSEKLFYRVASISLTHEKSDFSTPVEFEIPLAEFRKSQFIAAQPWKVPFSVGWSFGYGDLSQISSTQTLQSVSSSHPFYQNRFGVAAFLKKGPIAKLQFDFTFRWFAFQGVTTPHTYDQPVVRDYELQFCLGRPFQNFLKIPSLALALYVERSFSWIKSGYEGVQSQGGWSLGPAVSFSFFKDESSTIRLRPNLIALNIAFPLVGKWIGGPWGIISESWAQWGDFSLWKMKGNIKLFFEWNHRFWMNPTGTYRSQWQVGIMPALQF